MADSIAGRAPKRITIQLFDPMHRIQFMVSGDVGIKRPDVAVALKSSAVEASGYEVKGKIQDVNPGEYDVVLTGSFDNGQMMVCPSKRKILVK